MSVRWEKPYQDHRDGPSYNDSLVVRGEFFLDLGPFQTWDQELAAMNRGKRGASTASPNRSSAGSSSGCDCRLSGVGGDHAEDGGVAVDPHLP